MKKFQTKWKWKMRFWQIACEGEGGKEGMDAESPFCPIPSIDDSDKWNDGDVIEEGNSELGIHNVIFEMTNVTIQFHTHAPATRTRIHSVQLTNLIKSTKYWQLSILLHILTYRLAVAFLPLSLSLSVACSQAMSMLPCFVEGISSQNTSLHPLSPTPNLSASNFRRSKNKRNITSWNWKSHIHCIG